MTTASPPAPVPEIRSSRRIALTMGDPCGIGPEIILKALAARPARDVFVVGDVEVMRRAARAVGLDRPVAAFDDPADLDALPDGVVGVLSPPDLPAGLAALPMGRVDARAGAAAARCIEAAVRCVQAGTAGAITTAPLHKAALSLAGLPWPGHTEMLQSLGTREGVAPPVRMMLESPELRVVLVTIHLALRAAIDAVTHHAVLQTLRIAHAAGAALGWSGRRIAVAGLNPHAGEDGLFGREEIEVIAPAIAAARAEGIDAHGPFPPDTVFMRARRRPGQPAAFDAVVAMTHDHGLIPVKYLGVEDGVNVTLGLPFVRTSPDHGTAFDIAGTGVADPSSLLRALAVARAGLAGAAGPIRSA